MATSPLVAFPYDPYCPLDEYRLQLDASVTEWVP